MIIHTLEPTTISAMPVSFSPLLKERFGSQSDVESKTVKVMDFNTLLAQVEKIKKAKLPGVDQAINSLEKRGKASTRYALANAGIFIGSWLMVFASVFTLMPLLPIGIAAVAIPAVLLCTLLQMRQEKAMRKEYGDLTKKLGLAPDFKELPDSPKSLATA